MYDRNIKFGALLTEAHMKTLDNYVKGHMKIEEGYELVQDIPNPYIFIRVKGSPKKINTGLTMESLQHYTLSDSIKEEYMKGFPDIKTYEDVKYKGNIDEYVKELKSCDIITNDQILLLRLYDKIEEMSEVKKKKKGYSAH